METITSEQPTVPAEPMQPEQEPVAPRRSPLRAAIKTGRPKEWIKNVFVFAGLLFSGKFTEGHAVAEATITFFSFCLISSAGYYVNDLIDVELDRKHPKKKFRPLAAGELSERTAMLIAPVLAAIAIAIAFGAVNWEVGLMAVGYGVAQMPTASASSRS
jgi:decaprenyl-phosphate phosphoribosyltransferase